MDDVIIDVFYHPSTTTHDSVPSDFTAHKHPKDQHGHFIVTSVKRKKQMAAKGGRPTPKGKALQPFRSKNRKPSKHENPSGPGRERGLNPG